MIAPVTGQEARRQADPEHKISAGPRPDVGEPDLQLTVVASEQFPRLDGYLDHAAVNPCGLGEPDSISRACG